MRFSVALRRRLAAACLLLPWVVAIAADITTAQSAFARGRSLYFGSEGGPGSFQSCASCHGLDGRGGAEGGTQIPGLAAAFGPAASAARIDSAGMLCPLLRDGRYGGRQLSRSMPRYPMISADCEALFEYLSERSTQPLAGVTPQSIRIEVDFDAASPVQSRWVEHLRESVSNAVGQGQLFGRSILIEKSAATNVMTHPSPAPVLRLTLAPSLNPAPPALLAVGAYREDVGALTKSIASVRADRLDAILRFARVSFGVTARLLHIDAANDSAIPPAWLALAMLDSQWQLADSAVCTDAHSAVVVLWAADRPAAPVSVARAHRVEAKLAELARCASRVHWLIDLQSAALRTALRSLTATPWASVHVAAGAPPQAHGPEGAARLARVLVQAFRAAGTQLSEPRLVEAFNTAWQREGTGANALYRGAYLEQIDATTARSVGPGRWVPAQ